MAPLEGGVLVDLARLGGLAHWQRLIERPGKAEPALLLAQPGQRRASQRIEGALAIKAAAARQAVPLPAPAFDAARAAVRAFGIVVEALLQNTLHFVAIAALLQRRDHLPSLRVRQLRNQLIEPLQKLAMVHRAPSCRIRRPRMPSDCGRNPTHNSDSAKDKGFVEAVATMLRPGTFELDTQLLIAACLAPRLLLNLYRD